MPWSVKQDDRCPTAKPWGVVKQDDDSLEGCHASEDDARQQQKALYANESRSEETAEDLGFMDYLGPRLRAIFPDDELAEPMSLRSDDGAAPVMHGYLAVFDAPGKVDSAVEGRFIERISAGAFKKTIAERSKAIRVIYDHGRDSRFGRRPIAKLTDLHEDARGVYFEAEVLDTSDNRDALLPGLRAGLYGSSFSFRATKPPSVAHPSRSTTENPDKWPEVTIHELQMSEFGPTPFPIYDTPAVGIRSITDEYLMAQFADDPERLRALIDRLGIALPASEPDPSTPTEGAAPSPAAPITPVSDKEWHQWLQSI